MKERPIIFNAESIRAILDGRKTVTRRVIKPQPIKDKRNPDYRLPSWSLRQGRSCCEWFFGPQNSTKNGSLRFWRSPYGERGDRLWVKEAWMPMECCQDRVLYRTDDAAGHIEDGWKSPLFMPRSVSRIILDVVDVWAERLHELTLEEFCKEAIPLPKNNNAFMDPAKQCFAEYWDSINAKRGYPWEDNPWVWRVEFRRVE
ncbi:MAG: hypothetical protein HQL56_01060 [Magnetococcales bacterium]|nr:hypothetical protein [Magnetococcales bacterium]